jgi:hypothetical protein
MGVSSAAFAARNTHPESVLRRALSMFALRKNVSERRMPSVNVDRESERRTPTSRQGSELYRTADLFGAGRMIRFFPRLRFRILFCLWVACGQTGSQTQSVAERTEIARKKDPDVVALDTVEGVRRIPRNLAVLTDRSYTR